MKTYLEKRAKEQQIDDKERLSNKTKIDNSEELIAYRKFVNTLTPSQKNKEFERLKEKVKGIPVITDENLWDNLMGYKKLAMLFPNKKVSATSEDTVQDRLNHYSASFLPSSSKSKLDWVKLLKFHNSGKFNLKNWTVEEYKKTI